jgi:formylglycine-generating enzyme required for sulfatase activity
MIKLSLVLFLLISNTKLLAFDEFDECYDSCNYSDPFLTEEGNNIAATDCVNDCIDDHIDNLESQNTEQFYRIFERLAASKKIREFSKIKKVSYNLISIFKGPEVEMPSAPPFLVDTPVYDENGEQIPYTLKHDIEAMATEFTNGQLVSLMYQTDWWEKYSFRRCYALEIDDPKKRGEGCKDKLLTDEEINKPAVYLSWLDIQGYEENGQRVKGIVDYLEESDPEHCYRLPYEVEWQYMFQGTDRSTGWHAKEWIDYQALLTSGEFKRCRTRDVGEPGTENPKGFYDLWGNAWEWVYDTTGRLTGGKAIKTITTWHSDTTEHLSKNKTTKTITDMEKGYFEREGEAHVQRGACCESSLSGQVTGISIGSGALPGYAAEYLGSSTSGFRIVRLEKTGSKCPH